MWVLTRTPADHSKVHLDPSSVRKFCPHVAEISSPVLEFGGVWMEHHNELPDKQEDTLRKWEGGASHRSRDGEIETAEIEPAEMDGFLNNDMPTPTRAQWGRPWPWATTQVSRRSYYAMVILVIHALGTSMQSFHI